MEKMSFVSQKSDKLLNILLNKGFSYNEANKILRNKDVKINGKRVCQNVNVDGENQIEVYYNPKSDIEEEIVYQDENVVIVNKKQGIEIEGEEGLAKKMGAIAVHRLDRNTTGLVIFAKNKQSEKELLQAFKNHSIIKKYLCIVVGNPKFQDCAYSAFLKKDSKKSKVEIFSNRVKGSVLIESKFKTISTNGQTSLVECQLLTGKTHQIRAHLSYLGFPIVGDGKYGKNIDNKKLKEKYQKLHCYYLKFNNFNEKLKYLNNKEFIKYPNFNL